MIVHARAASNGPTHALDNKNNHPFTSSNFRLGLAHNGSIGEEAQFLKNKYQILSDTDSEFLLRIYENSLEDNCYYNIDNVPLHLSHKITGILDIWSIIKSGSMSVALGERLEQNSRDLFLFRNEKRPLWIADLRKTLGQIFFFSTPDIWIDALSDNSDLKNLCWGSQKIIKVPHSEIWHMQIDSSNPIVNKNNFFRFKVNVNQKIDEISDEYVPVKEQPIDLGLIT